MSPRQLDRYLLALAAATGAAALAAPLLTAGGGFEPRLVGPLAGVALVALLARGRAGVTMVALLSIAGGLIAAAGPSGGLTSPILLLVAVHVAVTAMVLDPVRQILAQSVTSLVLTVMALGAPRDFRLLILELGFLALLGFVTNLLAWRLRALREELELRGVRDPITGVASGPLFRANLAVRLEQARDGEGVFHLLLLELPAPAGEEALRRAGARLRAEVRGDDLVGRVGPARFAVALRTASREAGATVAERLARLFHSRGAAAFIGADRIGRDAVESARLLFETAEAELAAVSSAA